MKKLPYILAILILCGITPAFAQNYTTIMNPFDNHLQFVVDLNTMQPQATFQCATFNHLWATATAYMTNASTNYLRLSNYVFPTAAPADNQIFKYDAALGRINWEADAGAGISNIVEDLTPELGGDLDALGHNISGVEQATATYIWATGHLYALGDLTATGTIEGATLTEGGNAVYNSTETPGGELGGTWASPTLDTNVLTLDNVCDTGATTDQSITCSNITAGGGVFSLGTADTTRGIYALYSGSGSTGGYMYWVVPPDNDDDFSYYIMQVNADDFSIGTNLITDALLLEGVAAGSGATIFNINTDWDAAGTTCSNLGIVSAATSIEATTITEGGNAVPNVTENIIKQFAMHFTIDGGGEIISTGAKSWIRLPFACTITGWELTVDTSATITIDVWRDTYANFPPDNGDTLTNGHEPAIAAAVKAQDTDISDWTDVTLDVGDYVKINVDANDNATKAYLTIYGNKT